MARHGPPLPLYLSWPAELELEVDLSEADGRPEARLVLSFGGWPADVLVVAPLELGEASFAFVDPNGPDGGEVRYRGVLRDGTLRGVAAMHLPSEGLCMTGTREASR